MKEINDQITVLFGFHWYTIYVKFQVVLQMTQETTFVSGRLLVLNSECESPSFVFKEFSRTTLLSVSSERIQMTNQGPGYTSDLIMTKVIDITSA